MTDKFKALYNQFNPEQKEAVDWIEGSVMVVAGPGTGKTQVLTLRIANILMKTQVNPGNILALTFTENGAAEMRQRLVAIIGRAAYQVQIATFHGFCNDLIQTYPEEFGGILACQPASEVEQIDLLEKVIDTVPLKLLRPFGETYFYLREAQQMIGHLKREGIGPEQFGAIMQKEQKDFSAVSDLYYDSGRYQGKMKGKYADWKKQIDKNLELAKIYQKYQELLAEHKRYDYDDMILETAQVLERSPEFLLRLQERYQYFLVDEHQDTNNAQNKVLEKLSSFFSNPNLFVVGDEKQAIFRFQGASLANFLYFKKLYPSAKLITLKSNYRSTQPILDLAQSFIINNQRKISDIIPGVAENLVSTSKHPRNLVEIYEFKQGEVESYFVAQKISELLKSGVVPEAIAVIYRDNRDALDISAMLDKHGLPFRVESGENILADSEIQKLLKIFRFIHDWSSEEKLFELLTIDFLGIPALDIYKLNAPGVRRTISLLEHLSDPKKLKTAKVEQGEKILALTAKLFHWQRLSKNTPLLNLFEEVVRESGFLAQVLNHRHSAAALSKLEQLFREVKKLVASHPQTTLADFIAYLDNLERHGVSIRAGRGGSIPEAVRLMTAHGAKGLEFDHVFVINCFDGHWGNRRIPKLIKLPSLNPVANNLPLNPVVEGEDLKNDDERRLFYVAVTRARKMVYLSYAVRGWQKAQLPSQFLEEIKPELKKSGDASRYEKSFAADRQILYQAPQSKGWTVFEKDYLRELFYRRGLSATALNHYLDCPWKYFYLSLLKIPRAKSKAQIYGTAVHAALKDFFNYAKNGFPAADWLLARFTNALENEPLTNQEREEVLARGREVLAAYYKFYQNSFGDYPTLNEFRVRNVMLDFGPGLRLTGSLDKIEYLSDNLTNVVDYKTGRPRTRNELEGKTKNATGDYQRQLVFYKLLLDELPTFPSEMVSGEIDFVEPDKQGKFHKEKFEITKADVKELKEQLLQIADEIANFKFADKTCGDRECQFCRLKKGSA